jgi:hypothetical protein
LITSKLSIFAKKEKCRMSLPNAPGIVAKRGIKSGEVIFRESPTAAIQHYYSRLVVPACHNCLKTVGSLRTRIGSVLRSDHGGTEVLSSSPEKVKESIKKRELERKQLELGSSDDTGGDDTGETGGGGDDTGENSENQQKKKREERAKQFLKAYPKPKPLFFEAEYPDLAYHWPRRGH